MRQFLQRRWFLLLLACAVLVVWLWPEGLRWSAALKPRVAVAGALFLAAWSLESRRLYQSLLKPFPALWAVCVSYSIVPVLGWGVSAFVRVEDFRVGLLIITSVPCTLASALLWTRMAGGNEGTALLATVISTATSCLATTAWLSLTVGTAVALDSVAIMLDLFLILVLPLAAGQLCQAVGPLARVARSHAKILGVIAQLLIFVVILKAALDVRDSLEQQIVGLTAPLLLILGACVGLHVLALFIGLWSGRWIGFDRPTCSAIAFSCSQKTLPLSLYLLDAYFEKYPLAVVPIVLYHVGQYFVDTYVAEEMKARRS